MFAFILLPSAATATTMLEHLAEVALLGSLSGLGALRRRRRRRSHLDNLCVAAVAVGCCGGGRGGGGGGAPSLCAAAHVLGARKVAVKCRHVRVIDVDYGGSGGGE